MSQERREQSQPPIRLSIAQQETAQAVLGSLAELGKQRAVIVVGGLSGTGKTAMLESITPGIVQAGARVVEVEDLLYSSGPKLKAKKHTGPFITTATPFESRDLGKLLTSSDRGFTTVVSYRLKGMTEQEMLEYVSEIMNRNRSSLTAEQIAQYSLGIPLLAQQLLHAEVNEETAARMSADYLRSAIMYPYARLILNEARPFLNMPIPDKAVAALEEIAGDGRERHIYGYVYSALSKREQLREQGVQEESPFFVAPESEAIYDKMMALAGNESAKAIIEIAVPSLKPTDLERIQQAFGESYGKYDESRSTRKKMFRQADYRKAGIWTGDSDEFIAYLEGESTYINEAAAGYIRALKAGKLPLNWTDAPIFVLHKHAHGNQSDQVAQVGWMTESLLQQRGISYFVNNYILGASYVYNPESKHIEQLSLIIEVI